MDRNGDGVVDFTEFCAAYRSMTLLREYEMVGLRGCCSKGKS